MAYSRTSKALWAWAQMKCWINKSWCESVVRVCGWERGRRRQRNPSETIKEGNIVDVIMCVQAYMCGCCHESQSGPLWKPDGSVLECIHEGCVCVFICVCEFNHGRYHAEETLEPLTGKERKKRDRWEGERRINKRWKDDVRGEKCCFWRQLSQTNENTAFHLLWCKGYTLPRADLAKAQRRNFLRFAVEGGGRREGGEEEKRRGKKWWHLNATSYKCNPKGFSGGCLSWPCETAASQPLIPVNLVCCCWPAPSDRDVWGGRRHCKQLVFLWDAKWSDCLRDALLYLKIY